MVWPCFLNSSSNRAFDQNVSLDPPIWSVVNGSRSELGSTSPTQPHIYVSQSALPGGSYSGGVRSTSRVLSSVTPALTLMPSCPHHSVMNWAAVASSDSDAGQVIRRLIGLPSLSSRLPDASLTYPAAVSFSSALARSKPRRTDGSGATYHLDWNGGRRLVPGVPWPASTLSTSSWRLMPQASASRNAGSAVARVDEPPSLIAFG